MASASQLPSVSSLYSYYILDDVIFICKKNRASFKFSRRLIGRVNDFHVTFQGQRI